MRTTHLEQIVEQGMLHTTIISDGDSSAYKAITILNDGQVPYDIPVVKDFINHVSKRVGSRPRYLKRDMSESTRIRATRRTVMRSKQGGKGGLTD